MAAELALVKKGTVDIVAERVRSFLENKELHLPANYSPENAMKSAWLILQSTQTPDKRPVLEVCTRDSIANSLLDMIVQGLNPAKKQCYFIPYGQQLSCQRSYFGTMAVTKQVAGAKDVYAEVVYKGDEFEYELCRGSKRILKHVQRMENVGPGNIVAAYCVIEFHGDRPDYAEIMTMEQIRKSWEKSRNNANADSVHKQFPDQMAMRTVINRACKRYINTSNDDHLFLKHFNRADEELAEQELEEEVAEHANGEVIDVIQVPAEAKSAEAKPEGASETTEAPAEPAAATPKAAVPAAAKAPVQTTLDNTGPGY